MSEHKSIPNELFEKIAENDFLGFKLLLTQLKGDDINHADNNGMTLLQHCCCKGNKEAVQVLLDMGADVNSNKHGSSYTPLHFAALSGNVSVCRILLDAGVDPNITNSVSRTAAQMAAFVGNYACVETINNYVSRSKLENYIQLHGPAKEPFLPPFYLDSFHEFVVAVNIHPVRITLNLQSLGLLKILPSLKKTLTIMCESEIKRSYGVNEILAMKFHFLNWIISEFQRCEKHCELQSKENLLNREVTKIDYCEAFIKRLLKENKTGELEYIEYVVRDCVREFPFRECTIFRQIVSQLGAKDCQPAFSVLKIAINGLRGFAKSLSHCRTCGNENPDKKCSKCKSVQYCDRECQRLHWFMHKKNCARLSSSRVGNDERLGKPIDSNELRAELKNLSI